MDTDDLSKEAYTGILNHAEQFNHDLTLQFGVLAGKCKTENDYLENAAKLIVQLKKIRKNNLDYVFYDDLPAIQDFHKVLDEILINIARIKDIPEKERHYDF